MVAAGGVLLLGDLLGARVTQTSPPAGGEAAPFGRIGVTFAQPMQASLPPGAFYLQPAAPGHTFWEGQTLWFVPDKPLAAGATYTAHLQPGLKSQDGRVLKQAVTWKFSVRASWIVYLAPASGLPEVWRVPAQGGSPEQLTNTGGKVYDFSVSGDGEQIAYTLENSQGGKDLWIMDRNGKNQKELVSCAAQQCFQPAWSPDGQRIAYSRGSVPNPETSAANTRIWTVEVSSGQTAALYQDEKVHGIDPSWSPDGGRLAFYDTGVSALHVLDLHSGQETLLQSNTQQAGAWSPDGTQMLFTDVQQVGENLIAFVNQIDFKSGVVSTFLSNDQSQSDYTLPAWSPDGQWIAIAFQDANTITQRQIWLVRPDGSQMHAITQEPLYNHTGYQWDPWGQRLVYQRFQLLSSQSHPDIAIWDQQSGQTRIIAQDAAMPAWLP